LVGRYFIWDNCFLYIKNIFFIFFKQKIKKVFLLLICAIFTASEKMEILRKNSPDHNFLLFFGHGNFE